MWENGLYTHHVSVGSLLTALETQEDVPYFLTTLYTIWF